MSLRTKIKAIVLAWLVTEAVALAIAVQFLGWPATLLLGFLTSVLGFYVVRKAGRDGMTALRRAMEGASGLAIEIPSGGVLRIFSGLLLVIPGFISDLVGLVLLIPFVRTFALRRYSITPRSAPDGVVDLDPEEWRAGGAPQYDASCEPLSGVLPGGPKNVHSRRRDDE